MGEFTQSQIQRLNYIDYRLYFTGQVSRLDLIQRFDLSEAAATRDLRTYREKSPTNAFFDSISKAYRISDEFTPKFIGDKDARSILRAIVHGAGDDFTAPTSPLIPCELPTRLQAPRIEILAAISRSIFQKRVLKIMYRSASGSDHERAIVPYSLGGNGLRWHVRAFDRSQNRFSDFVINRIETAQMQPEEDISAEERQEADDDWNRMVKLEIVPHPKLENPEMIVLEYDMQDGMLSYKTRAALAGYVLRLWHVDCTKEATLEGNQYHLWLKNREALYGISNLEIAPGYKQI